MPRRSESSLPDPDLGMLTSRLYRAVQDEVWAELARQGFAELRPRHGAVLAYLDEEGVRASELARASGVHKQIIGTVTDELEALGYVERRPDPADRRAKLIFPTERGLTEIRTADGILKAMEERLAEELGPRAYARFKAALRSATEHLRQHAAG